eukprot:m.9559 g.9559  ORF g.9559 m.9559 type:complete len:1001 (-) comp2986_c0_seq1:1075-4077(-)
MSLQLDVPTALQRLQALHEALQKGNFGASSLALVLGKDDDNLKAQALQKWLFGYEIPDTLLVVAPGEALVLTSAKKAKFLAPLAEKTSDALKISILHRNKEDADKANFEKLTKRMAEADKRYAALAKGGAGAFCDAWAAALKESGLENTDATEAIGVFLAVKSETEIETMRKACQLSAAVLSKILRKQILDIIDEDKKVSHSKLARKVENELMPAKTAPAICTKLGIDHTQLDSCYEPIIQSQAPYSLKPGAQSDDKNLAQEGIFLCSLGCSYKNYCSNVGRSFIIQPTSQQQKDYEFLLELQTFVLEAIRPGKEFAQVYKDAAAFIEDKRPDLRPHFVKNLGFVIGIEFRDSTLILSTKNSRKIRENMTINLSLGFSGIPSKEENGSNYALMLIDTIVVKANECEVLTSLAKKDYKSIRFQFKEENDEAPMEEIVSHNANILENRTRGPTEMSNEMKRATHQAELAKELEEEVAKRLLNQAGTDQEVASKEDDIAYESYRKMPLEECRKLRIFIDKRHEAVILPIFGMAVPIHISAIKNLSMTEEEKGALLRINFATPTISTIEENENRVHLKEMVYKSQSRLPLQNALRLIKDLQKRFKTRQQELKQMENIVEQEDLILRKQGPRIALNDLYVRPSAGGKQKRMQGNLEAHVNGLRFTSRRNDRIDIIYKNIKCALYQPCKNEVVIMLHFHLKNPIMIGTKSYRDVQFYTEIGEAVTDLDKRRGDERDEIEQDQRERRMRKRATAMFEGFYKKVEELTKGKTDVEFDVPYPMLGFYGVPNKSTVFLQPTNSCLINIVDWPPLVLYLRDVERVHFERIVFGLSNFDMVFIFRDYSRKPVTIGAVPMKSLDAVKEWLDSVDIVFTEGPQNLNWVKIMKSITEDLQGFIETGGWSFLLPESDDEEEEAEDESSEFQPDSDEDEETDDDYTSSDEDDSDEGSASGGSDESGDESGKDWDDLEAEAEADDKKAAERDREAQATIRHKRPGGPEGRPSKKARKA